MNKIYVTNNKGTKLFECILDNIIKKNDNKNLKKLNDTLNSYLKSHMYDKGEPLFTISNNKLIFNSLSEKKDIDKILKGLQIKSDIEINRLLQSRICYSSVDDNNILIVLFFNESVGKNYINLVNEIISNYNIESLTCLILAKSFTPYFTKEINLQIYNSSHNFIYYKDDYFIDIKKHSFTPNEPIIYRGVDQLKLKGVKKQELPKLAITDPYAKYYMLKKDDIVEIERESGIDENLLDKQITYRHVTVLELDISSINDSI